MSAYGVYQETPHWNSQQILNSHWISNLETRKRHFTRTNCIISSPILLLILIPDF
jgi:hypothetical protein